MNNRTFEQRVLNSDLILKIVVRMIDYSFYRKLRPFLMAIRSELRRVVQAVCRECTGILGNFSKVAVISDKYANMRMTNLRMK